SGGNDDCASVVLSGGGIPGEDAAAAVASLPEPGGDRALRIAAVSIDAAQLEGITLCADAVHADRAGGGEGLRGDAEASRRGIGHAAFQQGERAEPARQQRRKIAPANVNSWAFDVGLTCSFRFHGRSCTVLTDTSSGATSYISEGRSTRQLEPNRGVAAGT